MRKFLIRFFNIRNSSSVTSAAVFLSIFFLLGSFAGCFIASYGGDEQSLISEAATFTEIRQTTAVSAFISVFKYPLIVFIVGLSAVGVAAIPAIMFVRGFLLSFSIATLVRLYGVSGLTFAASIFWVQCLFVCPCLMFFAVQGFLSSSMLFSLASGKGRKIAGQVFGNAYFIRSFICILALVLCVVLEVYATPFIAAWVSYTFLV